MSDEQPANWPDADQQYVCAEGSAVKILPPAHLTNLAWDSYKIGILQSPRPCSLRVILLGLQRHRKILNFQNFFHCCQDPARAFHHRQVGWSTEFWVSDCVVIDRMGAEKRQSVRSALRTNEPTERLFICVGLPVTTFGPLFNTIVSAYNGGTDSFGLSNGFIWVEALLDLHKFSIKLNPPQDPDQHPFLNMQRQMGDKSLLVEAKLTFTLETSIRMKTVIQAELLEVSNIRTTSTHKPINHTRIESTVV
ncbi:uncharacterized protein N7473_001628 [Penicillium subrubescens]|uniref:Uncharacterized protein n=1 Tax=Penicillium subrubescens TaxID=1316194 RepID=A0A1Q5UA52_9EURO|nr:uncharacterized protein N7473_001628 [Penicillium subrubescens]KAJ5904712.1 hypothetical protein N7473_001628 [Penicillium subrubescens]OKP09350.1 hypothetical protein PENSUB_5306 [Penicillium subrubescens]